MGVQEKPPTMTEIVAAIRTLNEPNNSSSIITKNAVATVLAGMLLALGAWLMSGLNSMQQSVIQVQTTVTALQHSVDQITQTGAQTGNIQGDMKTDIARLQQRVDQTEQRMNQLDGRGNENGNSPQGGGPRNTPPRV